MKKPNGWYGFQWSCDMHSYLSCNLYSDSESHQCTRKDRQGNVRAKSDLLACHWSVCPKLVQQRANAVKGDKAITLESQHKTGDTK